MNEKAPDYVLHNFVLKGNATSGDFRIVSQLAPTPWRRVLRPGCILPHGPSGYVFTIGEGTDYRGIPNIIVRRTAGPFNTAQESKCVLAWIRPIPEARAIRFHSGAVLESGAMFLRVILECLDVEGPITRLGVLRSDPAGANWNFSLDEETLQPIGGVRLKASEKCDLSDGYRIQFFPDENPNIPGKVLHSHDNGKTWSRVDGLNFFEFERLLSGPITFSKDERNTLFLAGVMKSTGSLETDTWRPIYSTDQGENWEYLDYWSFDDWQPHYYQLNQQLFRNSRQHLFLIGSEPLGDRTGALILRSEDTGQSWEISDRLSPEECCAEATGFCEDKEGNLYSIICIEQPDGKTILRKSRDGGKTWFDMDICYRGCTGGTWLKYTGGHLVWLAFVKMETGEWVLVTRASADGGLTWQSIDGAELDGNEELFFSVHPSGTLYMAFSRSCDENQGNGEAWLHQLWKLDLVSFRWLPINQAIKLETQDEKPADGFITSLNIGDSGRLFLTLYCGLKHEESGIFVSDDATEWRFFMVGAHMVVESVLEISPNELIFLVETGIRKTSGPTWRALAVTRDCLSENTYLCLYMHSFKYPTRPTAMVAMANNGLIVVGSWAEAFNEG